jgi:PEGA domain
LLGPGVSVNRGVGLNRLMRYTMRLYWKAVGLLALLLFVGIPVKLGADDLIPPTRTLDGPGRRLSRLTVVSEPPGLEAFLDGSKIGDTPVWHREVEPGLYTLRVGDSESDVFLAPAKTSIISYFKGTFVDVSKAREAAREKAPEPEKPASTEGAGRVLPREDRRPRDLSLWERFLTGISPSF